MMLHHFSPPNHVTAPDAATDPRCAWKAPWLAKLSTFDAASGGGGAGEFQHRSAPLALRDLRHVRKTRLKELPGEL